MDKITVKAGMIIPEGLGPYSNFKIVKVSSNGWCKCYNSNYKNAHGSPTKEQSVTNCRIHWIIQNGDYELIPSSIENEEGLNQS